MSTTTCIVIMTVCLILSGYFSATETAFSSANTTRLKTLAEKGKVSVELIPLSPMRDLRHIKGSIRELLDKKHVQSPEDFIYATLTDEEIIGDAMGIFQQVYPNTVKIDYDNSHTREIEQVDLSHIVENKSFSELISDFYQLMYQCEISEEEMDYMKMAAREAGVIHETE